MDRGNLETPGKPEIPPLLRVSRLHFARFQRNSVFMLYFSLSAPHADNGTHVSLCRLNPHLADNTHVAVHTALLTEAIRIRTLVRATPLR